MKIKIRADVKSAQNSIESIKTKIERKAKSAAEQAALKLFGLARSQITRSSRDVFITKSANLFNPKGEKLKTKPTQFVKDKVITQGKLKGRPVRDVSDVVSYKWTPKRGNKTKSYNNPNAAFRYWLRNQIRTEVVNSWLVVLYANPAKPKKGRILPTALFEKGGSVQWKRRIISGYTVETITHATIKKGKHKGKKRNFKKTRVALRRFWQPEGGVKSIAAAPFLQPALDKFMERYFKGIYGRINEIF